MKQKMAVTIVLIGLAGLIAGWFVGFSLGYHQGKLTNINSFEGTVICLEHKNPDQPHTLECAAGLKAEDGKTYTLKEGDVELTTLAGSDTRVRVQGTIRETESSQYQSAGDFTVDSYTILN